MTVPTMRAAVYHRHGPPDVLHVEDVPIPTVGPKDVLVRIEAASVNGGELPGRQGSLRALTGRRFPRRTGIDLVGVIEQLGAADALDYRRTTPADLGAFDVVVDTVGIDMQAWRELLAPGGRMVAITIDFRRLGESARAILGSVRLVGAVVGLERIADAHRALEAGGVRGKVVIDVAGTAGGPTG